MSTVLAKTLDKPVVATIYIPDPTYNPDEEGLGGEPGQRPIRLLFDPSNPDHVTPYEPRLDAGRWIPNFLACYSKTGNITEACRVAGVARFTVFRWRKASPDFDALVRAALDDAMDNLEGALIQRGLEKSDIAAFFMLKKHRPEYRDNYQPVQVQHTGPDGGPLKVEHAVRIYLPSNGRGDEMVAIEGEYQEVPALGDGEHE